MGQWIPPTPPLEEDILILHMASFLEQTIREVIYRGHKPSDVPLAPVLRETRLLWKNQSKNIVRRN